MNCRARDANRSTDGVTHGQLPDDESGFALSMKEMNSESHPHAGSCILALGARSVTVRVWIVWSLGFTASRLNVRGQRISTHLVDPESGAGLKRLSTEAVVGDMGPLAGRTNNRRFPEQLGL